jgi:hypothetical protein
MFSFVENYLIMKTFYILLLSLNTFISNPNSINPERKKLLDKVFLLLEEKVANPDWLKTKSFEEFKSDLYSEDVMKMTDEDFLSYFKKQRNTLPFSHFDLHSNTFLKGIEQETENQPVLYWKALNDHVAYMKVRTFITDAAPMIKAVSEIGTDRYDHLIIDLRNNGGGSLDAPVVLGRFLTQDYIDAGVYLTRKWFLQEQRSAVKEDILGFPFLQDFTFEGISKMYQNEAAFRMVLPPHANKTFQGKVYILIDSNTASACEPLIDILQQKKIGTVVGPRSAGNMLSGQTFKVNEQYEVFLPIADYQTADGRRLDQVGVIPEHKVSSENSLSYVLNELIGTKN